MRTKSIAVAGLATLAMAFTPGLAAAHVSSGSDPAPLLGAAQADAIPGEYIVVLKDGASAKSTTSVASLAKGYGAAIQHRYSAALQGFSAKLSPEALNAVRHNPSVEYVEANAEATMSATQSPTPSWGLDRIDQRDLPLNSTYNYNSTGNGVTAYVIDTGVRTTHSDFAGRASSGYDFVDNDPDASDCNGHGTHVSGTIGGVLHGVAKDVRIVGVRVLNCAGSGSWAGVISGIDWVTANAVKPAVANMSLGGGLNNSVNNAVTNSIASGVSYALAAGNSSADACTQSPAATPNAITVGATTSTDARASYSNFGTCLDIFAPGSAITSAWSTSDTATNTISGTSMASPHAAGVAALYLQTNPSASPQQVRDAMVNGGTPGKVGSPGAGSPNVLLYSLI
ncbi:MAG: S8 family peptidase [Micromonosporaceae bacterium]